LPVLANDVYNTVMIMLYLSMQIIFELAV